MSPQAIFSVQFVASLLAWGVIFTVFLAPWLAGRSRREALMWLLLPHTFRHIGLVFLVPGVVAQPLPEAFGPAAAYGDLGTALLALLSVVALQRRWRLAEAAVWGFSIVGVFDLANALRQPEPIPMFGSAWYIPTFLVPLLLVTHGLIVHRLVGARAGSSAARGGWAQAKAS